MSSDSNQWPTTFQPICKQISSLVDDKEDKLGLHFMTHIKEGCHNLLSKNLYT